MASEANQSSNVTQKEVGKPLANVTLAERLSSAPPVTLGTSNGGVPPKGIPAGVPQPAAASPAAKTSTTSASGAGVPSPAKSNSSSVGNVNGSANRYTPRQGGPMRGGNHRPMGRYGPNSNGGPGAAGGPPPPPPQGRGNYRGFRGGGMRHLDGRGGRGRMRGGPNDGFRDGGGHRNDFRRGPRGPFGPGYGPGGRGPHPGPGRGARGMPPPPPPPGRGHSAQHHGGNIPPPPPMPLHHGGGGGPNGPHGNIGPRGGVAMNPHGSYRPGSGYPPPPPPPGQQRFGNQGMNIHGPPHQQQHHQGHRGRSNFPPSQQQAPYHPSRPHAPQHQQQQHGQHRQMPQQQHGQHVGNGMMSPSQPFAPGHIPPPRHQQQHPSHPPPIQMPQVGGGTYQNHAPQSHPHHVPPLGNLPPHHAGTGIPAASSAVSAPPDQVPTNWSTHKAPTGVNYYYNVVTKKSTYDRPACLGPETGTSTTNATTGTLASTVSTATSEKAEQAWTEYKDPSTGKTYYSNGKTTTWDRPEGFTLPSESKKRSKDEESSTVKKKKKTELSLYANKDEAIAAFKGLLLAKDISPTLKWNDVVKLCSSDPRWEACRTVGERKQALTEYQTKRANELREQKRQEKVRAKDAFMALLTQVLPGVRAFQSSSSARFSEVRDSLSKDDRFYAVEEEETREEMFYEFVEEIQKREERQKRGRKRDAKDAFLGFLKYREENGGLTFAFTWTSFLGSLNDKDKVDARFVASPSMSDSDRQLYFADYVIELQAAEDEKRRRIRDARRRAEKAQRDAFRETLRKMAAEGKILPSSRWRNFEDILSAEETFGPVNEQDRSAPRDMFEDFVEDWADLYQRDKLLLKDLLSSSKSGIMKSDTEYEEFKNALLKAAEYSPECYSDVRRIINREEPVSNSKVLFDELVVNAKEGVEDKHRKSVIGNGAESSEDEGEIVEDGEVEDDAGTRNSDGQQIAEVQNQGK